MLDSIAEVFSVIIAQIYAVVPNFGLAIIIMTLMVKLLTFPLNNKQIQSTRKMQQLQPEMKKIQQKYKDDREQQNKVMSEFMKENNMNPLAGCLPLLVQFPILIGIFRLLREAEVFIVPRIENFSPYLFPSAEFIDLLLIPQVTFDNFLSQISIYYIFPLIAGGTTYLYSKMSMPADSSQKMLLYMMPVMITVFSFSFPVGLVIYWTMNNVFSIGQHKLINHLDASKAASAAKSDAEDKNDTVDKRESKPEKDPVKKAKQGEKKKQDKGKKGKGKR